MSDQELLEQLRSKKAQKALSKLYDHLPKVERLVRKNNGTRADAKDIFQDALIILFGKVKEPGFTLTCGIGTYLFAICRNRWQEELRQRGRFTRELEASPDEPSDLPALLADENRFAMAESALQSLGTTCLELLKRFYILKESMTQIAKAIGLSGEGAAKTRKYKCLEEARKRYRAALAKQDIHPVTA